VLDVRDAAEHRAGHVPGAKSVPLESLRSRLRTLDGRGAVVCYCDTGRRGYLAARTLRQQGIADAANLEGGFRSWQWSGLSVEIGRKR
jgi:rhodanese-related sulfurtransferase